MPANEQTWRNTRLLHVVFGVSAVAMLVSTIWMLVADHEREWKQYQRTFRKVAVWQADAREAQERSDEFVRQQEELEEALTEARATVPDRSLIDVFVALVEENGSGRQRDLSVVEQAYEALAANPGPATRERLVGRLNDFVAAARVREENTSREMKFARADLDVVRSTHGILVGEGAAPERIAEAQGRIDEVAARVDERTRLYQEANTYRVALERTLAAINEPVSQVERALDAHQRSLEQLIQTRQQQVITPAEQLLTMPILDAFSSPLRIDQIWLPQLTLNNNFRDVARFDRCTTCHQGIDVTAPGSASEPGFVPQIETTFLLDTPAPDAAGEVAGDDATRTVRDVYGMDLAPQGLIDPQAVTINVVRPYSRAAAAVQVEGDRPLAPQSLEWTNPPGTGSSGRSQLFQFPPGLQPGDVIVEIGGVRILDRDRAHTYLLDVVNWGQPLEIKVRRGLPHPFSTHPRLDLYLGSTSPHQKGDFGCTICHQGQGSATSFQWASHTPNTPRQERGWVRDHQWFENHHWILPMFPERFVESTCLQCHHDVVELAPSARFPDPPAPKVMRGYELVRDNGCFGCHEILGFNGPTVRIGPDLRTEPSYAPAAIEMLTDPGLTDDQRQMAAALVDDPTDAALRRRLAQSIGEMMAEAKSNDDAPPLHERTVLMAELIGARDETPGAMRRVGPSLRYVASKVSPEFLYDWIREPKHFRPSTNMPQFFGLFEHLEPKYSPEASVHTEGEAEVAAHAARQEPHRTAQLESIEIHSLVAYLESRSQPFAYLERPAEVDQPPSEERGRELFQLRGCLACHSHEAFPEAVSDFGPDLSRLGSKLTGAEGAKWLYTWLREPSTYHARTRMPDTFLLPERSEIDGRAAVTDPAADIAAFLLAGDGSQEPWTPLPAPEIDPEVKRELLLEYLRGVFTERQANEIADTGVPENLAADLKGDERLLVGISSLPEDERQQRQLEYLGSRTIRKYGCFGCHDIPGFEDAKPIGTGLADWGRKDPARLAFEQVNQLVSRLYGHGGHLDIDSLDADTGFFMQSLLAHQREGFLWQKLRMPRSYDYETTQKKMYSERLRMPKFNFTPDEVEAVMTFVLGLVADPPELEYVYRPDPTQQAVVDGRKVLEKYNCGGCHVLEMESWQFEYDPEELPGPPPFNDYAFLRPNFTPEALAASEATDPRGMGHASAHGMPLVDGEGVPIEDEDDDGNPLFFFTLWQEKAINGDAWRVGDQVPVSLGQLIKRRDPVGGFLARLIYPLALEQELAVNPNAKASDAWGWVPPPLVGEGHKVQTDWLYQFLLDPQPIRPAVVLRMPKFNMSPDEATSLVNYFAAVDGARHPYVADPRTRPSHLAAAEAARPGRLDDALKLVTDNNYCVKCHLIGDFTPEGSIKALAPNLDDVHRRLRPEYVRDWIANPQRILPYTGMPVNFDPHELKGQELFEGSSLEQLEAVVDLLLNFNSFMAGRNPIAPMIQPAPPAEQAAGGGE